MSLDDDVLILYDLSAAQLLVDFEGPADVAFRRIVAAYVASAETRPRLQQVLDVVRFGLLLGLGHRQAEFADREEAPERLLDALTAHLLEDFRWDARENFSRLVVPYHVAVKLDVDPVKLFAGAREVALPNGAHYLDIFIKESPVFKSLDAMSVREVMGPHGVRYEHYSTRAMTTIPLGVAPVARRAAFAWTFSGTCARGHDFMAPDLAAHARGQYLLDNASGSAHVLLDLVEDPLYSELRAVIAIACPHLNTRDQTELATRVYPLSCDPSPRGDRYRMGEPPRCPRCGAERTNEWSALRPARPWPLEWPTLARWRALSASERTDLVRSSAQI